jgi:3-oxoacyl-[acyl-carrier-protein] synthase-3
MIYASGLYAPGKAIDNQELQSLAEIEFDSEKIEQKLGIKTRHIARLRAMDESTADFAEKASTMALAQGGISADDLDLIIVATDTPEYISPSTAVLLQGRLQNRQKSTMAFDLNSSCAGFVQALHTAVSILQNTPWMKFALVCGVYNMPAFVRPGDVFGYSIFADGAGAVIISKNDLDKYQGSHMISDGTQWDYVGIYTGAAKKPYTPELFEGEEYGLQLLQRLPGDRNVKLWPDTVHKLLENCGSRLDEVDHFFFTQINRAVIQEVMEILGRSMDDTSCIMDRYGYTGSGCIPMAIHDAREQGRISKGDRVVTVASGAGLSVGANLFTL